MSVTYRAVGWNRQKRLYDRTLLSGILLYLLLFLGVGLWLRPGATIETLLIRAFGTGALLLLHVVLSIGPLSRLDRRFLPLLYNRRHLGVATFLLGCLHGGFATFQFHALGDLNPLLSVLSANERLDSLAQFPFQPLGLAALVILFLMAATSHDFWLTQLTAPQWKRLHMAAYVAYGLLVAHVALGALQAETHPGLALLLCLGVAWIVGLHLVAGWRERSADRGAAEAGGDGFVDVGPAVEIESGRAKIVCLSGERVAIFRDGDRFFALSNVCQHQNGPLGEGRVIDGCAVCPWHGYEYELADGRSPAPFNERVPTFNLRLIEGRIWVDPQPNPAGTAVEPVTLGSDARAPEPNEFYIGYKGSAPPLLGRQLRRTVAGLFLLVAVIALVTSSWQSPFAAADFEYGDVRTFAGRLSTEPYPILHSGDSPATQRSRLLVAFGKKGAADDVAGLDGREIEITGQRIVRGSTEMIELASAPVAGDIAQHLRSAAPTLGERKLVGEIVDSKCHLGVMKPGDGKTHRGCAVRCISGGAPPMLWVRNGDGDEAHYLLVGRDDRPLGPELLDRVAEPVSVTGELLRIEGLWTLRTEPQEIDRLEADEP